MKNLEHRPIPNCLGYIVSEFGEVYSLKTRRYLKPQDNGTGYQYVTLRVEGQSKNFTIQRIMSLTFMGQRPEGKSDINHIDGDKKNNHVTNLEWCDRSENMLHAYRTKLRYPPSRKRVTQIDPQNGDSLNTYESINQAARSVGRCPSNIQVAIRDNGIAAGFKWKLSQN